VKHHLGCVTVVSGNLDGPCDCGNVCPQCGNITSREEVDIGVGTLWGPARCANCGWQEETPDVGGIEDEEPVEEMW